MAGNKKRGFTKLEKVLAGIIILIVVGFLGSKYSTIFVSRESLLRSRYNEYVSLINDKKYSEAYNYLSSYAKTKNSPSDLSSNGKQQVTINNIIVDGDTGYIDRSNVACQDESCSAKLTFRGYKEWIFENGNWYYSGNDPRCIRDKPYDMPPEFERVLSLIKQRFKDVYKDSVDMSFLNCVDIEYGDVGNAEGQFIFDENNSNIDKLNIKVDRSYVNDDDLLTAFLLVHETSHAVVYLGKIEDGLKISCVDDEVNSFYAQLLFSTLLNREELNSINARIMNGDQYNNKQLGIESELFILQNQALKICGDNSYTQCVIDKVKGLIKNTVASDPYYQKECGL